MTGLAIITGASSGLGSAFAKALVLAVSDFETLFGQRF